VLLLERHHPFTPIDANLEVERLAAGALS